MVQEVVCPVQKNSTVSSRSNATRCITLNFYLKLVQKIPKWSVQNTKTQILVLLGLMKLRLYKDLMQTQQRGKVKLKYYFINMCFDKP